MNKTNPFNEEEIERDRIRWGEYYKQLAEKRKRSKIESVERKVLEEIEIKKAIEKKKQEKRERKREYHREYDKKRAEKRKKYREENKERIRENARQKRLAESEEEAKERRSKKREYFRNHPDIERGYVQNRRARKKNAEGKIGKDDIKILTEAQGGKCLMCGKKTKLTLDHIVPLSKGGRNDITNFQMLCHSCNSKKHTTIKDLRSKGLLKRIFTQGELFA